MQANGAGRRGARSRFVGYGRARHSRSSREWIAMRRGGARGRDGRRSGRTRDAAKDGENRAGGQKRLGQQVAFRSSSEPTAQQEREPHLLCLDALVLRELLVGDGAHRGDTETVRAVVRLALVQAAEGLWSGQCADQYCCPVNRPGMGWASGASEDASGARRVGLGGRRSPDPSGWSGAGTSQVQSCPRLGGRPAVCSARSAFSPRVRDPRSPARSTRPRRRLGD